MGSATDGGSTGVGSTALPSVALAVSEGPDEAPHEDVAPHEVRVVVCDDHRMLAEGLKALLDAAPDLNVVDVVHSVGELMESVGRDHPDVLVLDFELTDGTGIDALRLLRQSAPEIRVIMLTAFADDTILVQAIEAGCAGFLTKQKATADLVEAVRMVADGEAVVAPDLLARLLPRFGSSRGRIPTPLTRREQQVLELLAEGTSSARIAAELGVSPNTVRNHVQAVLTKLDAHSRLEAVATATRVGLLPRRPGVTLMGRN